jgi:hypothetical protein
MQFCDGKGCKCIGNRTYIRLNNLCLSMSERFLRIWRRISRTNKLLRLGPAIFYIVLSLTLGEVHPFSKFEMYDYFPSSALAFNLREPNGKMLAVNRYFNYHTAEISHNYVAANDKYHSIEEDSLKRRILVGESIMNQIRSHSRIQLPNDTVILNMVLITVGHTGPVLQEHTIYSKSFYDL